LQRQTRAHYLLFEQIMPANGLGGQIRELNICRELDVGQCKVAELLSCSVIDRTRRRHSVAKRLISCGGRVCHVEVTWYALGHMVSID
jgi:hypothetical protein